MACNDHFTLLNRVSATLLAVSDARSGHGSLGRLQTQGNGEATAGPNWMGPNVHTVEDSGRCQHLASLGTDFRAVHAVMESPFSRVESTPLPKTAEPRNVGGYTANLEDPPAVSGCHVTLRCSPGLDVEGANWSSERETTTGH